MGECRCHGIGQPFRKPNIRIAHERAQPHDCGDEQVGRPVYGFDGIAPVEDLLAVHPDKIHDKQRQKRRIAVVDLAEHRVCGGPKIFAQPRQQPQKHTQQIDYQRPSLFLAKRATGGCQPVVVDAGKGGHIRPPDKAHQQENNRSREKRYGCCDGTEGKEVHRLTDIGFV